MLFLNIVCDGYSVLLFFANQNTQLEINIGDFCTLAILLLCKHCVCNIIQKYFAGMIEQTCYSRSNKSDFSSISPLSQAKVKWQGKVHLSAFAYYKDVKQKQETKLGILVDITKA